MQITINLSPEQEALVNALAARSGKKREDLTREALEKFLIQEEYGKDFLDSLLTGIAEADAGDFASDEAVDAVFKKYGARR